MQWIFSTILRDIIGLYYGVVKSDFEFGKIIIVHRMFTYEEGSIISIITKVNREDERFANNEERTECFWNVDVHRNGHRHDDFQFMAQWVTRQDVRA